MNLVRDLLDKLIRDEAGRAIGRVDGLTIEFAGSKPPRLTSILVGPRVLGDRLHPLVGRWVAALELGFGIEEARPVRIDMKDVDAIDVDVWVRIGAKQAALEAIEQRLRRWLRRLPEIQ
jgi:sporulation protein YlmC with PRC-barrel domain